jgi:hypothetical protein
MNYRGYDLEEKTLSVGWQVVIMKDGSFVRNSGVFPNLKSAVAEAHAYIDSLIDKSPNHVG